MWGKQRGKKKRFRNYEPLCLREKKRKKNTRTESWEKKKKMSQLHETQLTSSTKLPPDHYKNHLIGNHFVRSIDSNWKNNKKLIMLQMWPRKMSLVLERNDNSTFQLPLTAQTSVFSSTKIYQRRDTECELNCLFCYI